MGALVLDGNPPVTVRLRRSARARRLSLRVSRLDGRVTLTLPPYVPEREAVTFLHAREEWLRRHLSHVAPETPVQIGTRLPFRGGELHIAPATGRQLRVADGVLYLPEGYPGKRAAAFLKLQARDALVAASDRYAGQLGRSYGKITLRDTRSRWGSCSSRGDLMYSWRLIMAPPDVLDYVAAHEVAHLVHMDHSAQFWSVVENLFPNHKSCRTWLRDHGTGLHQFRFD